MPEESTGEPEVPTPKTEIPGTDSKNRSAEPGAGLGAANPKTRAAVTGQTRAQAAPNGTHPTSARPARTSQAGPGAWATGTDVLGTAVQATAELAEIGLTFWTRTLRDAVSRLPRP